MAAAAAVLLAAILALAPVGVLAGTAHPQMMPAACGIMTGLLSDQNPDDGRSMACCDAVCLIVGGCAVLPLPQGVLEPVVVERPVPALPRFAACSGLVGGPEPPPPRAGVA